MLDLTMAQRLASQMQYLQTIQTDPRLGHRPEERRRGVDRVDPLVKGAPAVGQGIAKLFRTEHVQDPARIRVVRISHVPKAKA